MSLTSAQKRAIAHVEARAEKAREAARADIAAILGWAHLPPDALAAATAHARVTLSFHPDRLRPSDGTSVALGLLRDGRYVSQFVTGVTNGAPTAHAGGSRDDWEHALFGDAYRGADVVAAGRVKYGGLNVMQHGDGASPRFGSCFFELRPHVLARCTLTWGDSHGGPEHVGTAAVFEPVLAALLRTCKETRAALGVREVGLAGLVERMTTSTPRAHGRALDDYIEAQVHGDIELDEDVAALVIDPSFVGTPIGDQLGKLASTHHFQLRIHDGFVLLPDEVPTDFRGERMPALARRVLAVARKAHIDAHAIGVAAASLHLDSAAWSDWDTAPETWQHLKQLWHVLVAYGHTVTSSAGPFPSHRS